MTPIVAIVGRPNVGKSTLFNRLIGARQALVDDRPGVTRDRHYGEATLRDRDVVVVDTGGFEPRPEDDLFAGVRRQAEAAVAEADVVLFVVDVRVGLSPADQMTADLLRRSMRPDQPLLLVVNKCDGPKQDDDAAEFWQLGLAGMICISAEHGRGIDELVDAVEEHLPPAPEVEVAADGEAPADDGEIRIAVIGKPNIGKSTLVNRLLGEERHVVHDSPGTTMDAIDSVFEEDGQRYRVVDTAGIRRRARIDDKLEGFAVGRAIKTIERCHVILLMLDGLQGISHQDARLAALAIERGRGVILLINRWDLARQDPEISSATIEDQIREHLPHLSWAPVLYIAALTGKGCHRILPLVRDVYAEFDKRVPTAALNRWLEAALAAYAPPQKHNHRVRLNYITQTRVRPPTFTLWSNSPDAVLPAYKRYLEGRLREAFGFQGAPLRIQVRKKRKPGESAEEDA